MQINLISKNKFSKIKFSRTKRSTKFKTLFFDGRIKHAMKVAQKVLNCNFILLMSKKHICIMHYEYDNNNDNSLT